MSNTVEPLASAVNIAAPPPTFMNRLKARPLNRGAWGRVLITAIILICFIMFVVRMSRKNKKKEEYEVAKVKVKNAMKKVRKFFR